MDKHRDGLSDQRTLLQLTLYLRLAPPLSVGRSRRLRMALTDKRITAFGLLLLHLPILLTLSSSSNLCGAKTNSVRRHVSWQPRRSRFSSVSFKTSSPSTSQS